jgi:hypothetical protein
MLLNKIIFIWLELRFVYYNIWLVVLFHSSSNLIFIIDSSHFITLTIQQQNEWSNQSTIFSSKYIERDEKREGGV